MKEWCHSLSFHQETLTEWMKSKLQESWVTMVNEQKCKFNGLREAKQNSSSIKATLVLAMSLYDHKAILKIHFKFNINTYVTVSRPINYSKSEPNEVLEDRLSQLKHDSDYSSIRNDLKRCLKSDHCPLPALDQKIEEDHIRRKAHSPKLIKRPVRYSGAPLNQQRTRLSP